MHELRWTAPAAVVAVSFGWLVVEMGAAALALAALVGYIVFAVQRPAAAASTWLVATLAIPCWYGATLPTVGYVQPAVALGLLLLAGLWMSSHGGHVRKFDVVVAAVVGLAFLATQFLTPAAVAKGVLLGVFVPYLIGRALYPYRAKVERTFAIATVLLALAAVLELITRFHPFVGTGGGSPIAYWADLQTRGSFDRSEVSLGHALALGATLVLGFPFVMQHLERRRLWSFIVILGVLATLSRGPILAVVLCLLLMLAPGLGLPQIRRLRGGLVVGAAALTIAVLPLLGGIASGEGRGLQDSANYRVAILDVVPTVRPLGLADGAVFDPEINAYVFGRFGSIDNAVLELALNIGWLPVCLLVLGYLLLLVRYVRGRGDAATIGLLAQLPVLLSVPLITQWPVVLFFVAGLAASVTSATRASSTVSSRSRTTASPRA